MKAGWTVGQRGSFGRLIGWSMALLAAAAAAQSTTPAHDTPSRVWVADQGDGTYKNPVLYADYSDPDVVRVGSDFYLVSSSFNQVPGIPILQSKDLVNWHLIGHVFARQPPEDVYRTPQHGDGAWAPSIRYHNGEFFVFYPDPDYGIYMVKARSIQGPWSKPLLIKAARGWIDPCPLWDDDGNAYLINALAGSRAGMKSVLILSRMSADGTRLLDDGTLIIDGHKDDPTLEGPKLYKRDGFYYVFAPAGGVSTGWQVVFRSKNIYGPYERRVVLAQGQTKVNGPHQGAWVQTQQGEDWFLHFQDQGPYGRVVYLEPMRWHDGWPVMGQDPGNTGTGEPVLSYRKPRVQPPDGLATPPDSDEFNGNHLGEQWQWEANPEPGWAFPAPALGVLRLAAVPSAEGSKDLWNLPNALLQKLPAQQFTVTTKVKFTSRLAGETTGLLVLGQSYAYIGVRNSGSGLVVEQVECPDARPVEPKTVSSKPVALTGDTVYLRATVRAGAVVTFAYSLNGETFEPLGAPFQATAGRWVGARIGLFALGAAGSGEHGFADYDWFRFSPE
jgi:beta-xylosidase